MPVRSINEIYGTVTIKTAGDALSVTFQHHPKLSAKLDYMDNDPFRMTYSNQSYGILSTKFTVANGKVMSVDIKASDSCSTTLTYLPNNVTHFLTRFLAPD